MRLIVFGYNRGPVPPADLVVDCRVLDNPDRHPQYRQLTGRDPEIQAYVRASPGFERFWDRLLQVVTFEAEWSGAVVALGCAFGKHRSRAVARLAWEQLEAEMLTLMVRGKDSSAARVAAFVRNRCQQVLRETLSFGEGADGKVGDEQRELGTVG